MADEKRGASPQSVTRVIRILEALCASAGPVSLAELSRVLDTPKSSLAALLRGLAEEDFVMVADGAWKLGPGAFGLGGALLEARRNLQSSDILRDGMKRLVAASGETVLFAVRDFAGETITYVDVVESHAAVRFAVAVGDRRPLYCTAGGRMLLAMMPEREVDAYLAGLRPERFSADSLTDRADLAVAIAAARRAGVAQTVDQAGDGVTGTAAPIRDASGMVLGALVAAAPSSRLHDRLPMLRRLVMDEARIISRNLGWRN